MFEQLKAKLAQPWGNTTHLLPDYGLLYFDNLCGEYLSLPTAIVEAAPVIAKHSPAADTLPVVALAEAEAAAGVVNDTTALDNNSSGVTATEAVAGLELAEDIPASASTAKLPAINTEQARGILDGIMQQHRERLTWRDLYTFDLILARLQPSEKLARKVWSLGARYRDVVGLREYEAYLSSKPPELSAQTNELALRADIDYLLGQLHLRYAIRPLREVTRDKLSRWVAYITLAGIIWVLIVVALLVGESSLVTSLFGHHSNAAANFSVVLFAGAMGGLVSMQQRFQSAGDEGDPIHNISELRYGWFSIFLSPISGAIFSVVLYLVISGGLLQGELFPQMFSPTPPASGVALGFVEFLQHMGPMTHADYAKLLVWSFIAGFAERFVPDTLSRFVAKKEQDNKTGS